MFDLQTIPQRDESFCERELGEETIFLSPKGDQIHALDAIGTYIWKQLDGKTALTEVIDRLCSEYEVSREQAEPDLLKFINDLAKNKLLVSE